jgi:hypothetical protein
MEHFLPLAIASMVISLISIILLDYFGPTTISNPEKNEMSDPSEVGITSLNDEVDIKTEETKVEIKKGLKYLLNPLNSDSTKEERFRLA